VSDEERLEAAVDAAIAAVRAEHGDWYAGMADAYRHVVSSAVRGALKAAA